MKKINTSQSKRTSFLIWLMFLGGVLISMPVKAQSTVSELQQLINDVPANGTKVLDLGGKTYQQADLLEITGGRNITLKNGTLLRNNFYSPGKFVHVADSYLTLESFTIDGNEKNKNTRGPLISLISSELTVKSGTVIKNNDIMLRRIIAFWGDLSLCSRPHFAALRLLYLTLQATVQVAYLIINIIELQFSPCTFLLPIREIFIPFPGFSRYDVPFTNHFLSSFHCFFVGFPCFPLRKCIAIPLFHYATFCFRMSDLLNTSVSGDSSKTVRLVIIVCT